MKHGLTGALGLIVLVLAAAAALVADVVRQWSRPTDSGPRRPRERVVLLGVSLLALLLTALGAVATLLRLLALT